MHSRGGVQHGRRAAEAIVGLIALLVVELLPDQVMLLFGAQNESIHYTLFARRCFRVYLSMIVLACINKGTFIFLQSLGKAAASTLLSMAREIVFGVGLVLLLPQFFQLDGVIYSMPAADVLTAILSAVVLVRTYRSLNGEVSNTEKPGRILRNRGDSTRLCF